MKSILEWRALEDVKEDAEQTPDETDKAHSESLDPEIVNTKDPAIKTQESQFDHGDGDRVSDDTAHHQLEDLALAS